MNLIFVKKNLLSKYYLLLFTKFFITLNYTMYIEIISDYNKKKWTVKCMRQQWTEASYLQETPTHKRGNSS